MARRTGQVWPGHSLARFSLSYPSNFQRSLCYANWGHVNKGHANKSYANKGHANKSIPDQRGWVSGNGGGAS